MDTTMPEAGGARPGPPRERPSDNRTLALIVAAGIAGFLAMVSIAVFTLASLADRLTKDDPSEVAAAEAAEYDMYEAAEALSQVSATRYTGFVIDDRRRQIPVDVRVSPKGATLATLTVSGRKVELLAAGGRTFVRADQAYWRSRGTPSDVLAEFGKQWVKITPDEFGFDFAKMLAPAALAGQLDWAADRGETRVGPETTIDGVRARAVRTSDLVVYVSADPPKRILRITSPGMETASAQPSGYQTTGVRRGQGTFHEVRAPGDAGFQFDLSGLSNTEIEDFYSRLDQKIRELKNSVDSQVRFSLNGSITLAPCSTSGCTANVRLSNRVDSTSQYLAVRQPVTASITIQMTLDGRPIANCVTTKSMQPNGSATATCRAAYVIPPSRNPRTHLVQAQFSAVARAVAQADITRLAADVKKELEAARRSRSGTQTPAPTVGASPGVRISPGAPLPENPMTLVPANAQSRTLTPHSGGGAQYGVEYKWTQDGQTYRLRVHGPDGTAPPGSNAATGVTYRLQVGQRYFDRDGRLHPRGVHNPDSSNYDPAAANATHIPWPPGVPYPWSK
ncbi:polymorphic toxin type 30 domain-containing protein [Micromonospora sp. CPCC 206061]|uniref:polymorphic toxin type 30 domain-containing protein n=1 Tax=Micromonospora sp. CPCC 206061 TaxID=3122410 RepID=UPI002FF1450B